MPAPPSRWLGISLPCSPGGGERGRQPLRAGVDPREPFPHTSAATTSVRAAFAAVLPPPGTAPLRSAAGSSNVDSSSSALPKSQLSCVEDRGSPQPGLPLLPLLPGGSSFPAGVVYCTGNNLPTVPSIVSFGERELWLSSTVMYVYIHSDANAAFARRLEDKEEPPRNLNRGTVQSCVWCIIGAERTKDPVLLRLRSTLLNVQNDCCVFSVVPLLLRLCLVCDGKIYLSKLGKGVGTGTPTIEYFSWNRHRRKER